MTPEKIIVITAPSGSGKTTLVKRLLAAYPVLAFSVSACTRKPRNGEVDGKDYYFYDAETFKKLIDEDAFIEWEMVYPGKYYGTLKSEILRIREANKYPLVDIDVKGALAIQEKYRDVTLSIFIEAPSIDELRRRLLARGTETPDSIEERIDKSLHELAFSHQFDRIIINDDLEKATVELVNTVEAFISGPAKANA